MWPMGLMLVFHMNLLTWYKCILKKHVTNDIFLQWTSKIRVFHEHRCKTHLLLNCFLSSWFELHASIMINLNTLHWLLNWMFAAPVPCFMLPTCRKQKGQSWSVIRWPIRGDDCWSTFPNTLAIKRWIFCPPTTPWIRSSAQWHQMVSTLIGRGPSQ